MSEPILQDTFHQYLDQTIQANPLKQSDRVKALHMALGRPHWDDRLPEMGWVMVSCFTDPGSRMEDRIKIRLDQYDESSTCCGEGYYEIIVDGEGTAVSGHTEYRVNGQLVRQCRIEPALGQKIADEVFRGLLKSGVADVNVDSESEIN